MGVDLRLPVYVPACLYSRLPICLLYHNRPDLLGGDIIVILLVSVECFITFPQRAVTLQHETRYTNSEIKQRESCVPTPQPPPTPTLVNSH